MNWNSEDMTFPQFLVQTVVEGEKYRTAIGIADFFAEIQLHILLTTLLTIN